MIASMVCRPSPMFAPARGAVARVAAATKRATVKTTH
jgi:hypothetical protein